MIGILISQCKVYYFTARYFNYFYPCLIWGEKCQQHLERKNRKTYQKTWLNSRNNNTNAMNNWTTFSSCESTEKQSHHSSDSAITTVKRRCSFRLSQNWDPFTSLKRSPSRTRMMLAYSKTKRSTIICTLLEERMNLNFSILIFLLQIDNLTIIKDITFLHTAVKRFLESTHG